MGIRAPKLPLNFLQEVSSSSLGGPRAGSEMASIIWQLHPYAQNLFGYNIIKIFYGYFEETAEKKCLGAFYTLSPRGAIGLNFFSYLEISFNKR